MQIGLTRTTVGILVRVLCGDLLSCLKILFHLLSYYCFYILSDEPLNIGFWSFTYYPLCECFCRKGTKDICFSSPDNRGFVDAVELFAFPIVEKIVLIIGGGLWGVSEFLVYYRGIDGSLLRKKIGLINEWESSLLTGVIAVPKWGLGDLSSRP